jgi:glycosyltransferase involved in cell wall biosynthesis
MNIDLVFPKLPPALDGIGDHTARLAEALAAGGAAQRVRVLTAQQEAAALPGVAVERAFSLERRRGVRELLPAVRADPPDWLFLQFNQFSYGRWGLNPYLPLTVRRIQQQFPAVRVAVLFHEDFVPAAGWKSAAMTLWQRMQFWVLGRSADLVFFSISPWIEQYRSWFPNTPLRHLPVGSNMPRIATTREEARRRIGIDEETFVAGVFGSAHGSRLLGHVGRAAEALQQRTGDFVVLYVGPHGEAVRSALPGAPLIDAGRLPGEEVSRHLAAMDLHLAPFMDGVSTRRGSFMAGLQHGVPTVSTRGKQTDAMLQKQEGHAFFLVEEGDREGVARSAQRLLDHPLQRRHMARCSRAFYDAHFDWPCIAAALVRGIDEVGQAAEPSLPSSSSLLN